MKLKRKAVVITEKSKDENWKPLGSWQKRHLLSDEAGWMSSGYKGKGETF